MRPDQEFKSVANCHAIGLYSHPLYVTKEKVERLFVDTLGNCHTVAPHSHRYKLDLRIVAGSMNHSLWIKSPNGALPMYHFNWEAPLNGYEGRFVPTGEAARYNVSSRILKAGDTISMTASGIHSLVTEPGTSWLINEYLDETEETVTLHPYPVYSPDLTGLYVVL